MMEFWGHLQMRVDMTFHQVAHFCFLLVGGAYVSIGRTFFIKPPLASPPWKKRGCKRASSSIPTASCIEVCLQRPVR